MLYYWNSRLDSEVFVNLLLLSFSPGVLRLSSRSRSRRFVDIYLKFCESETFGISSESDFSKLYSMMSIGDLYGLLGVVFEWLPLCVKLYLVSFFVSLSFSWSSSKTSERSRFLRHFVKVRTTTKAMSRPIRTIPPKKSPIFSKSELSSVSMILVSNTLS